MAKRVIRIAATIGVLTGLVATLKGVMGAAKSGGWLQAADVATGAVTGFSFQQGNWDWHRMVFTIPAAVGIGASAVAAKAKVNKYMPFKGVAF